MNGWDVKEIFDDVFFECVNVAYALRARVCSLARKMGLKNNDKYKNAFLDESFFILGNAPSINDFELDKLKGKNVICANRFFLHPSYSNIKPKFHIIIDQKLGTGEWPISFIEDILHLSPSTTLILNGNWRGLDRFADYKDRENIIWLHMPLFPTRFTKNIPDITKLSWGGAVIEQAILFSMYAGVRDIFLLGVEGNNVCYNLIGQKSHFYGVNSEDITVDCKVIYRDLYFLSLFIKRFMIIERIAKKHNVNIFNLSDKGIMYMFESKCYVDVVE